MTPTRKAYKKNYKNKKKSSLKNRKIRFEHYVKLSNILILRKESHKKSTFSLNQTPWKFGKESHSNSWHSFFALVLTFLTPHISPYYSHSCQEYAVWSESWEINWFSQRSRIKFTCWPALFSWMTNKIIGEAMVAQSVSAMTSRNFQSREMKYNTFKSALKLSFSSPN